MAKQWHPLFGHLLGLSLGEHYRIEPEEPVSDIPRAGDFLVVRRTSASPPFTGLWSNLTEYNVLEFKGPDESPTDMHLLKLLAVGFGLAFKENERRAAERQPPVRPSRFSFWYLVPFISEEFHRLAMDRATFAYDGGGVYRANVCGHPWFMVCTRHLPIEEDSIPLKLVSKAEQPRALGELIVGREGLKERFGSFLAFLHRKLFEEVRGMAGRTGIVDWEVLAQYDDAKEIIDIIPPAEVIERLGVKKAIEAMGEKKAIEAMGVKKAVEAMGLPRVIQEVGPEQYLAALEASMPPEQFQALLATRAKKDGGA
ncbi:MAG: hypothetical protein K2W96_14300 [Gemmataceae bacterium]|nr:hypothetical protein [Gemmataceae bacterium]